MQNDLLCIININLYKKETPSRQTIPNGVSFNFHLKIEREKSNITATNSYAAGIAYSLYGTINASYCYNHGNISGADGAGGIAPKAQYGSGDKANYCLNGGVITSSNGIAYQASNNNVECFYYHNGDLLNVSDNSVATSADALALLNGGADANFFEVDNGKIVVK